MLKWHAAALTTLLIQRVCGHVEILLNTWEKITTLYKNYTNIYRSHAHLCHWTVRNVLIHNETDCLFIIFLLTFHVQEQMVHQLWNNMCNKGCSRWFIVYLFIGFAGVSYGQFIAILTISLVCQRMFKTGVIGRRGCKWRDLNGETLAADNRR